MRVALDPDGQLEWSGAFDHYAREGSADVADRFTSAVDRTLDAIAGGTAVPQWVARKRGVRRVLVDGFPYQVVYVERGDVALVVAVGHLSRAPGYWLSRTR